MRTDIDSSEKHFKEFKTTQPFVATTSISMLRVTVASVIELTDYLLNDIKYSYVLTAKFNQDCLEVFSITLNVSVTGLISFYDRDSFV